MRPCSVEGCPEPHRSNGFCNKHRQAWRTYGDPLAAKRVRSYEGAACTIDGCDEPAVSRGWCNTHYLRWKNHGDPLALIKVSAYPPDAVCAICGEGPVVARGWCDMHYNRWKRHGDPNMVGRSGQKLKHGPTCAADGCQKPNQIGKPYCGAHAARFAKYGDPLGSAPPRPLDPDPSYFAMHQRIVKDRGKASDYPCADCGGASKDWSYDYTGVIRFSGVLAFSSSTADYSPRCRACHKAFDLAHQATAPS